MSVQECAPRSILEPRTGCPGLPLQCTGRSTHLETQPTPANHRGSHFTGHQIQATKKGHLLDHVSPQIWGADTRLYQSICLPSEMPSSQPWMYLFTLLPSFQKAEDARQKQQHAVLHCQWRIIHQQFYPCWGTKLLPGEVSPRGSREVVLATSRGEAGGQAQTECPSRPHCSVSPMVRCSPGRKEHAAPKTNTKPEHFLLYFSYRPFVIQKRIEERAIIKPLMCY